MEINRIGLLTSGGDAPGMNSAIRAVVRTACINKLETLGIRRGYNGLINGDVTEMGYRDVRGLNHMGGTILYTARSPEFQTEEGVAKAAKTCKYLGIDAIICIGGDGTFRGALDLAKHGIPSVGIPATIDNDIACTNYTIGFDTACNTAIEAIDKLRDTMHSHERCSLVEVMGHRAGHLAVYVGISVGANAILVPERPYDFEKDIADRIRKSRIQGRTHFDIIVAEGVGDIHQIANHIREETGLDPRVTILGHVQRGGTPTARDRVTAARMGRHAVELLLEGRFNRVVSIKDGHLQDFDIEEALSMKKDLQETMVETARILSTG
ncbi:MAG: 6-phosphofructokinase [Oscillospiraceae bacterium]|nr:6-phosphofructokinase [Oscillospiraceae bacterium]